MNNYTILKKYSKIITEIEKPIKINNDLLNHDLLNPFLKKYFFDTIEINTVVNTIYLNKIYKFIKKLLEKKGKILFILPDDFIYKQINKNFITLLKKYNHFYSCSENIINGPGLITNLKTLREHKKTDIKKFHLIFILNTEISYTENIIKEATLLQIPVISIVNYKINIINITYPTISDINLQTLMFYYFLKTIFCINLSC